MFSEEILFNSTSSFKSIVYELASDLGLNKELLNKNIDIVETTYKQNKDHYESKYSFLASNITYILDDAGWSYLAGRLEVYNIQLTLRPYHEYVELCRPLMNTEAHSFFETYSDILSSFLVMTRDYRFDYFAINTLKKTYLWTRKTNGKNVTIETPQYMYLRMAVQMWMKDNPTEKTFNLIKQTYNDLTGVDGKNPLYTHASPVMFNSCAKKPQLASCFLTTIGDSVTSISKKAWHDTANISKNGGGIGINIGDIRHSEIAETIISDGIVPLLKVVNDILNYIGQKYRKGSATIYIPCWHTDIFDFLELKKNTGSEYRRARDLFYAVWVSDLFLKRVYKDDMWSLFCPNKAKGLNDTHGTEFEMLYIKYEQEGIYERQVKARDVFKHIYISLIETGGPFMMSKDNVNRKSNQKNLGTIKNSNLCVHGDTLILTKNGYRPIKNLKNKKVIVWNGKEWNKTTVVKTGTGKNLLHIEFNNGTFIECTKQHRFFLSNHKKIRARKLKVDHVLIDFDLPVCENSQYSSEYDSEYEFEVSYSTGFALGEDAYNKDNVHLHIKAPQQAFLHDKIEWFAGYVDANGTLDEKKSVLTITHSNKEFLISVHLMLQTLSVKSKISLVLFDEYRYIYTNRYKPQYRSIVAYDENDCFEDTYRGLYKLTVNHNNLNVLYKHKLKLRSVQKMPCYKDDEIDENEIKVVSVRKGQINQDTYCFTESIRGMGMFNGVLTGQCTEIAQFTSKDEIASCNLGSVCLDSCVIPLKGECKYCSELMFVNKNKAQYNDWLPVYFDFEKLEFTVRRLVRNINQCIDRTYYMKKIPEIKYANLKNRPMGIGVQGLADTFAKLDLPFTCKKAKRLNTLIYETLYYAFVSESVNIAKEKYMKHYKIVNPIKTSIQSASEKGDASKVMALERELYRCEKEWTGSAYKSFKESPAYEGYLHFDLWAAEQVEHISFIKYNNKPTYDEFMGILNEVDLKLTSIMSGRYDWISLKKEIKVYGMNNSLGIAQMPTASSAHINRRNESCEPFQEIISTRTVLSGQYLLLNRYAVADLKEIGVWNNETIKNIIDNKGSVQNLFFDHLDKNSQNRLQHIKEKFKTVYEIPQKELVDMNIERGVFVDQAISFNVHKKLLSYQQMCSLAFDQWLGGSKTLWYYTRGKSSYKAKNIAAKKEYSAKKDINTQAVTTQAATTQAVCTACVL